MTSTYLTVRNTLVLLKNKIVQKIALKLIIKYICCFYRKYFLKSDKLKNAVNKYIFKSYFISDGKNILILK